MCVRLFVICLIRILLSTSEIALCNPITNTNFNDHIREYSLTEDNNSSAKTLSKVSGRYASFAPIDHSARIKEFPDTASSSSKGISYYEHPGHSIHDHEEIPSYEGYGYPDTYHHSPHGFHSVYDHGLQHVGHTHSHGHYNHALAAKAVLWPLAGLALLGAAAALVTNPILLQLGVATGKRRRRDTLVPELPWPQDIPKELQTCLETPPVKNKQKRKRTVDRFNSEENYIKIPTKSKDT